MPAQGKHKLNKKCVELVWIHFSVIFTSEDEIVLLIDI